MHSPVSQYETGQGLENGGSSGGATPNRFENATENNWEQRGDPLILVHSISPQDNQEDVAIAFNASRSPDQSAPRSPSVLMGPSIHTPDQTLVETRLTFQKPPGLGANKDPSINMMVNRANEATNELHDGKQCLISSPISI